MGNQTWTARFLDRAAQQNHRQSWRSFYLGVGMLYLINGHGGCFH